MKGGGTYGCDSAVVRAADLVPKHKNNRQTFLSPAWLWPDSSLVGSVPYVWEQRLLVWGMPNQSLLKYKLVLMSTTRCAGGGGKVRRAQGRGERGSWGKIDWETRGVKTEYNYSTVSFIVVYRCRLSTAEVNLRLPGNSFQPNLTVVLWLLFRIGSDHVPRFIFGFPTVWHS